MLKNQKKTTGKDHEEKAVIKLHDEPCTKRGSEDKKTRRP